ncbi:MAG: hypothetical protein MUE84_06800 [Hyphomonas sp.]|jgi:hypothetical protein|nr:hypothetical protein [Hyphomonas sp.]
MPPAFALLAAVLSSSLVGCSGDSPQLTLSPQTFTAKDWQANRGNDRYDMVQDLIERVGLRGRGRTEVLALLKAPGKRDGPSDLYFLCPSDMDIYVLQIGWGDEKIASATIRDT